MFFWSKRKSETKELAKRNINLEKTDHSLLNKFFIPEPTKSLLWITNENVSKISSPHQIRINITLGKDGVRTDHVDESYSFFSEPSLIWTDLPIQRNSELETEKMYYPSYSGLSPKCRFQYLDWLRDIAKETNLSYVFLYYYGLERHLLLGNYDLALEEILKLIKTHSEKSFVSYATGSVIAASSYRKKTEVVEKAPFLFEGVSNDSLILKKLAGIPLIASDIIHLASRAKYSNRKYIKASPELFKRELQKQIDNYQKKNGDILGNIDINRLPKLEQIFFANLSLPDNIRYLKAPDLINDEEFLSILRNLLKQTSEKVKKYET